MGVIPGVEKVRAGGPFGELLVARGLYDFATDGGAVGDIVLRGDTIPSGAIITDALIYVTTIPTSGGSATIAAKVQGAADIQAAAAYSGAPWSTAAAAVRCSAVTATAAPIVTTAARTPTITVATAALTAGTFTVLVMYYVLETQT